MLMIQTVLRWKKNESELKNLAPGRESLRRKALEKARLLLKFKFVHLLCNYILGLTWSRPTSFLSRRMCGVMAITTALATLGEQYAALD